MWTHMPQCYLPPGRGDITAFTPAKLVLDLLIPEGCKAELTWLVGWLHPEMKPIQHNQTQCRVTPFMCLTIKPCRQPLQVEEGAMCIYVSLMCADNL